MPGLGQSILSFCLRVGELAFAATVAGLTGEYLAANHESDWSQKRFIYTEVIAGLSILLALLWLLPFSGGFIHWPVDLLISVAWFVAFGLLVNVSFSTLPFLSRRSVQLTVLSLLVLLTAAPSSTGEILLTREHARNGRLISLSASSPLSFGSSALFS
jgi:hypothetical protein